MGDLRYAVRVLTKAPVFAATAVLTLALCIGANTAIYTVVDRVLLRPLPYPEPDRLADVATHYERQGDQDGQTGGTWEALRDGVTSADLAAYSGLGMGVNLQAQGRPEYVRQQRVSAGFFRVLGVPPAIGREFTADEDRPEGPALAVLSHTLWIRLGADPGIVGRAITLRGAPHTVVGVMPASFSSGSQIDPVLVDVWTPLHPRKGGEGGGNNYGIIARLRRGVSWPQADAEFAAVGQPVLDDLYRATHDRPRQHIIPLQRAWTAEVRQPVLVLWAAVAVVLLIGCVNVAGLLIARSAVRRPEIAMRIALGGGRRAIMRQLMIESLVLAAAGGCAGILLGYAGSAAFASLLERAFGLPGIAGLDLRVLAVTGAGALGTSVLFGLLPALQATRVNLRDTLVESGATTIAGGAHPWPRRVMVLTEIALGVVLLVGAGLLLRTFDYLMALSPGFDGAHVATATLSLQDVRYQTPERVNQLFEQTLARMRATPGVEDAAAALTLPYERALNVGFRWVGGAPQSYTINYTYVTPGYFETLKIPLRRGRVFTDADAASAAAVVVVNDAFVRRHSLDRDPVGRQIVSGSVRTIVGVVGDIQTKSAFGNFGPVGAAPAAYVPAAQVSGPFLTMAHTWFSPSFFVRTAGPLPGVIQEMQRAIQSVDSTLPFAKFRMVNDVRDDAVASQRAQSTLLGALAALALLLAAVGLYGLVASSVAERTRELGIRVALGATSRRVVASAALPGALLAVAGIVIGLIAARLAATTLSHLVWGVSVSDPLTFAAAAGLVLAVALLAAVVPALRIVRLNPVKALRTA